MLCVEAVFTHSCCCASASYGGDLWQDVEVKLYTFWTLASGKVEWSASCLLLILYPV